SPTPLMSDVRRASTWKQAFMRARGDDEFFQGLRKPDISSYEHEAARVSPVGILRRSANSAA
ncbi:MAG: hypothetical protein ACYTEK_18475, partial [Planctomycetota bacterium]